MKANAGSAFASFLSKGTTLTLPKGRPLSKSRAAAAAAILGVAFLSGAAHAQTATPDTGTSTQPRIVAPAIVPPYAKPGAMMTKPVTAAPVAAAPTAAPAPAPATTSAPARIAAPQVTSTSAQPPHAARTQSGSQQSGHPQRDSRRRGDTFNSAPFALGAAIGFAATAQPVYSAPGYIDEPGVADGYVADPYARPPAYSTPSYDVGYRAEDARDPGFARGNPQIIPDGGRMRDPETFNKSFVFGGERLGGQAVMATVAAARIAGVTPAALLALQSRSLEATELAAAREGASDNPESPIDGPYAYSIQRWQSAISRFGGSIGIGGAVAKATGGASGNPAADISNTLALRSDPYISGLMAGAEMASNDAAYRQAFGVGPTMAELVIGHHVGQPAMLRLSQIYRQSPDAPLASVVKPNFARDLVTLTGLSGLQPPDPRGWTVGSMINTIDNALKNALTRYAAADRIVLPTDYKPETKVLARAGYVPNYDKDEPASPRYPAPGRF
jgi:hypothetical protein